MRVMGKNTHRGSGGRHPHRVSPWRIGAFGGGLTGTRRRAARGATVLGRIRGKGGGWYRERRRANFNMPTKCNHFVSNTFYKYYYDDFMFTVFTDVEQLRSVKKNSELRKKNRSVVGSQGMTWLGIGRRGECPAKHPCQVSVGNIAVRAREKMEIKKWCSETIDSKNCKKHANF